MRDRARLRLLTLVAMGLACLLSAVPPATAGEAASASADAFRTEFRVAAPANTPEWRAAVVAFVRALAPAVAAANVTFAGL